MVVRAEGECQGEDKKLCIEGLKEKGKGDDRVGKRFRELNSTRVREKKREA